MSWSLKLDFLGLTALVPLGDGRWLVVLPDLRRGSDPRDDLKIDSHQPLVSVSPRFVHNSSTALPPRLETLSADGERLALFELERHFVRLEGSGEGVREVRDGSDLDISSVPRMGAIQSEAAFLSPFLLSDWEDDKVAPAAGTAATFLLDCGQLAARDIFREMKQASQYDFKVSYVDPTVFSLPKMADGFRLTVELDRPHATLMLGDANTGDVKTLVLDPLGEPEVEVRIHNEELESILGFDNDPLAASQGDLDFKIFYRLSTGWLELKDRPLPVPFRWSDRPSGGGKNKPCRGALFDGVGL